MAAREPTAGAPFPQAPWAASKFDERLNLAVKTGHRRIHLEQKEYRGSPPRHGSTTGQTYNVDGWTIESEEPRTKFTYGATGKGMYLGIVTLRHF